MSNARWLAFAGGVIFVLAGCDCGSSGADSGSDRSTDAGTDSAAPFTWDAGPPVGAGRDPTVPAPCGESRAGVIEVGQEAALIGGIRGEGRTGVGDVALYNCRVRFVVQGVREGNGYLPSGGALIDADLVRAPGEPGWDMIDELATVFTPFRTFVADEAVGVLADGSDGGAAIVRAIGTDQELGLLAGAIGAMSVPQNIWAIQDYILEPDVSYVRIETRLVFVGTHSAEVPIGDFFMLSDHASDPVMPGPGFDRTGHAGFVPMVGACGERNEVCYGAFGEEGDVELVIGEFLAFFGGGGDFSLFPYFVGEVKQPLFEEVTFGRYLAVGADLAEVTAALFEVQGTATVLASGMVTELGSGVGVEGARVHLVATAAGRSYVTWAMTDSSGGWNADVPAGDYEVTVTGSGNGQDAELLVTPPLPHPWADGRGRGDTVAVTIDGSQASIDLSIGPEGTANITLLDETGTPAPGKVIFEFGPGGDPSAEDPMLGERDAYGFARKVAFTIDGNYRFPIEPGTYNVIGAAGFDAEIDVRPDEVVDPSVGPLTLTLDLPRVVDHTDWWSADNHTHAAGSMHGEATLEERVVTVAAEGLDFFVSSDHDMVMDYQPTIELIGADTVLKNIVGEEISPIWAHFNAFPVVPDPSLPNNGAVPWWTDMGFSLAEIVDWARTTLQAGVIQINHGRSPGYFNASGFDPVTGMFTRPELFDDTITVMEIANGKGTGQREDLIIDFYALLNMGHRMVGTGTSDAHGLLGGEPGYGRSYYYMPAVTSIPDITGALVAEAANAGRLLVSGGPFLEVDLLGGTLGDVVVPAGAGPYDLSIEIRAPSWMEVQSVQVVANGALEASFVVDPAMATPPVWFSAAVPVDPAADAWYVVRVDGASLSPVYPGANVFALSNPIYLDLAGDGFDAPGL